VNGDALNELATAFALAQGEMENAAYNKVNPHFKSSYADLASVRAATMPALSKHGLSIVQFTKTMAPIEGGPITVLLVTRLLHKSGQYIDSHYPVQTGTPQQMGSALTYARRYIWTAMCGIAADADDDGNVAEASYGKDNALKPKQSAHKARKEGDYPSMEKEIRALTSINAINVWWVSNQARIEALPDTWQQHLREEGERRVAEIESGVTEEGKPANGLKKQLQDSLDKA
jgi:hypothetical protein